MDGLLLALDRLDRAAARPIALQLADALRAAVRDGVARPGEAVPSTRALAARLGVSRGVVVRAYEQLAGEGCLELRPGSGARVAAVPEPTPAPRSRAPQTPAPRTPAARIPAAAAAAPARSAAPAAGPTSPIASARPSGPSGPSGPPPSSPPAAASAHRPRRASDAAEPAPTTVDLGPGLPSVARLDARAWRAAWRAAAGEPVPVAAGDPAGDERLRAAIAEHLRLARGVACSADEVRVTAGTSEALSILALALAERLGRTPHLAVEDPGYPGARRVLARHGARLQPVPVDDDGFDADALAAAAPAPDAVLLTPSHQYPLGGRLPLPRRLALVDWARRTGGLLVEDDYDSEFRHTGAPLPALASLDDTGRVVLVGTLSKVLTPSLRLGWLVVRDPSLRAAIDLVRAELDNPVPTLVQRATARLLESGMLRRHIALVRREYAHRRELVQRMLGGLDGAAPGGSGLRLRGLDGGLHAVLELPSVADEAAAVARLAAEGVRVAPLGAYSLDAGAPGRPAGIVFGYAAPSDLQLAGALERMRAAVLDAMPGAAPGPAPGPVPDAAPDPAPGVAPGTRPGHAPGPAS